MYGLQTQLTQKIPITDEMGIDHVSSGEVLLPCNSAEIFIPLESDLEIKFIGTFRSTILRQGRMYFFKPRGRGMSILGKTSYATIKIHPGYTRTIIETLIEVANGIYTLNMPGHLINTIIQKAGYSYIFQLCDILEEIFGLENTDPNSVIIEAIDLVKDSAGSITIKDIYSDLDISKSTLEQRFNREIGLTPKEFCKIEKLNGFIETYRRSDGASLTELTYECGYYDQSHLIKDFRYFMDMCPKDYFR